MSAFTSRLTRLLQVFRSNPNPGRKDHETLDLDVIGLCTEPHPEELRGEMAALLPVGGEAVSVVDASRHALL